MRSRKQREKEHDHEYQRTSKISGEHQGFGGAV